MFNQSHKLFFGASVLLAVVGLALTISATTRLKANADTTLEQRVAALEALLSGVQRGTSAPDARGRTTSYLYFPMRVGIETDYWAKQPPGEGAALSVTTGYDRRGAYIWNETSDLDGLIYGLLSDVTVYRPGRTGQNIGLATIVTNGPQGNEGLHVMSQYGGGHPDYPITPILADEINVDGVLQKRVILSPNGLLTRGGAQPSNSFWGAIFGDGSRQLFP